MQVLWGVGGMVVLLAIAFQVLPVIIFFAALTSELYYWGILQWVVKLLGGTLQFALRTSKAESTVAASTIFVGMFEAPLVVKPHIERATKSELFTMMGTGLATVAGSLLVGYSLLGVRLDYLLAAAFMAGPAAIVMSKIIVPEVGEPETLVASGVDETEVKHFSQKTVAIVTFGLTGFANFGSISPGRRHEAAQFGIRAVLAGTPANLMNATIAGILIG